jgi:hypothetical protein
MDYQLKANQQEGQMGRDWFTPFKSKVEKEGVAGDISTGLGVQIPPRTF